MNSSLVQHTKTFLPTFYENSKDELIANLYRLKGRFELLYYGKAECKKYDKARAFTIALNATIYQANQLQRGMDYPTENYKPSDAKKAEIYREGYKRSRKDLKQISLKIRQLEKELNDLID